MEDITPKLRRLAKQPAWKKTLFNTVIALALALRHIIDFYHYLNVHFPRRRFILHRHPRWHYVGSGIVKPPRTVYALITIAITLGAFIVADPIYWVISFGFTVSLAVILWSIIMIYGGVQSILVRISKRQQ
jgi:hypothetical protein